LRIIAPIPEDLNRDGGYDVPAVINKFFETTLRLFKDG